MDGTNLIPKSVVVSLTTVTVLLIFSRTSEKKFSNIYHQAGIKLLTRLRWLARAQLSIWLWRHLKHVMQGAHRFPKTTILDSFLQVSQNNNPWLILELYLTKLRCPWLKRTQNRRGSQEDTTYFIRMISNTYIIKSYLLLIGNQKAFVKILSPLMKLLKTSQFIHNVWRKSLKTSWFQWSRGVFLNISRRTSPFIPLLLLWHLQVPLL